MAEPDSRVDPVRPLGGPGFEVVEAVKGALARHDMLQVGSTVLVAVSGGPDSVCLLDCLLRLAPSMDLDVQVAHVDHGLGERSAEIAARVSRKATEMGLDVHLLRVPDDLAGPNLQARARDFRLGFFQTVAQQIGADRYATGHTLDDRVETTLARLVHGAGTDVLAGLRPVDSDRISPLIEVRRSATRSYCEACDLEFYDDPANDDDSFERVAVRRRLISAIEARWGPGAVEAMATSIERVTEDSDLLSGLAEGIVKKLVTATDESTSIDTDELVGLPRALRRRVLERMTGRVRDRSGGIDATLDHLDKGPLQGTARFAVAGGREFVVTKESVALGGPAEPSNRGP